MLARKPRSPLQSQRPILSIERLEARDLPSVAGLGLHLTAVSPTQVQLSWNDLPGATGYQVMSWDGTGTKTIATLGAQANSYTATGLTANQTQWFDLEAIGSDGSTEYTPWGSIQTPVDPVTVPANFGAVAQGSGSILLSWQTPTGATGLHIYEWNGTKPVQIADLKPDATSLKVSNLSSATTYYFYIEAYNASSAVQSDWASAKTATAPISAPAAFSAKSVSQTRIDLSWSSASGAAGYRIYTWDGSKAVLLATLGNVTSYAATKLQPGTAYWFYVEAFNGGSTAETGWQRGVTVPLTPLAPPTNVHVTLVGTHAIDITWQASATATGYRVYLYDGANWVLETTVTKTSAQIGNLPRGHTYYILVQAYDATETANSTRLTYSL